MAQGVHSQKAPPLVPTSPSAHLQLLSMGVYAWLPVAATSPWNSCHSGSHTASLMYRAPRLSRRRGINIYFLKFALVRVLRVVEGCSVC